MKKVIISLFVVLLLVGCGSNVGGIDGLSESERTMLQEAGISEEEFSAMPKDKQDALLYELGVAYEHKQEKPKPETNIDDVSKGGNYVVTVGDSMLWNYFKLYYQDGKLVKIEVSFQKNDEEPADVQTFEGDAIKDCTIFFIDYTQDPKSVISALIDKGYSRVSIEKV